MNTEVKGTLISRLRDRDTELAAATDTELARLDGVVRDWVTLRKELARVTGTALELEDVRALVQRHLASIFERIGIPLPPAPSPAELRRVSRAGKKRVAAALGPRNDDRPAP